MTMRKQRASTLPETELSMGACSGGFFIAAISARDCSSFALLEWWQSPRTIKRTTASSGIFGMMSSLSFVYWLAGIVYTSDNPQAFLLYGYFVGLRLASVQSTRQERFTSLFNAREARRPGFSAERDALSCQLHIKVRLLALRTHHHHRAHRRHLAVLLHRQCSSFLCVL